MVTCSEVGSTTTAGVASAVCTHTTPVYSAWLCMLYRVEWKYVRTPYTEVSYPNSTLMRGVVFVRNPEERKKTKKNFWHQIIHEKIATRWWELSRFLGENLFIKIIYTLQIKRHLGLLGNTGKHWILKFTMNGVNKVSN